MHLRRLALLPILVLGGVLLLSPEASGRAGGGQHYSSPSRSSGGGSRSWGGGSHSSGGSWGSGGGDIYISSGHRRPMTPGESKAFIAVMLAIGVVVLIAHALNVLNNSQTSDQVSTEVRRMDERRLRPPEDLNNALARLREDDPDFDLDAFFERTKRVFLDIQEGWFLRNLDTVRLYMSDGLYRRFTTLLSLMQLENQRNALADTTVLGAQLMEVNRTNAFDCLTVRIHASMRDVDVPASLTDEQARRKAQAAGVADFTELWTFVRRRGAHTRKELDASQGKCPHCGAPFTGGAANKCEYCGSIINSGNYDWVLAEITQPSEYLPHNRSAPGLEALQERDPDAAAEILQDRGLLLFWKWLEAWAFGDIRRLQKLSLPTTLAGFGGEIEGMKRRGERFVLRVPAVGGTRVAAVETGVNGFDRVHVEVRWSAVTGVGQVSQYASPQSYRSIVTLVRASGAMTDRGAGLSNERCGNCGAPLTNSDSTACDYCGHDLSGASREWQLADIVPIEHWQRPATARPSLDAFATPGERRRLMTVLVMVARADGVVDAREIRLLKDCAARWQIPWTEVQGLLERGVDDPFGTLQPKSDREARAFLSQMIVAAKADGQVDRREKALIYETARHMKLDVASVDAMLA